MFDAQYACYEPFCNRDDRDCFTHERSMHHSFYLHIADIATDVSTAIQDKDTTKIAPTSLGYGKAFVEFQKFQKQLLTDIIPDILTRGVPKLVDEAPELFSQISSQGPEGLEGLAKKGQELLSTVQVIDKRLFISEAAGAQTNLLKH